MLTFTINVSPNKTGLFESSFFFKKDMTYDKIKSHKKPECHLSIVLSRRSN